MREEVDWLINSTVHLGDRRNGIRGCKVENGGA